MSEKIKFVSSKWLEYAAIAVPFAVCFLLTVPLFGWIIDDAGISFVYARNLAAGNGLVSQPGVPPVEGFSNPLWVFILAPFYAVGLFHPFIVPKALSILLVGAAFFFIHRILQQLTGIKFTLSFIVLFFLSTNASFVIWTCSGLENPLFVALISFLLYLIVKDSTEKRESNKLAILAGIVASAIALTRPDGLVYVLIFPVSIFLKQIPLKKEKVVGSIKTMASYAVAFLLIFGSYIIFRKLYFGEFYPNTYFAKGGPTISVALDALTLQPAYLTKLQEILQSIFGSKLWLLIPTVIVLWLALIIREGKWHRQATVLFLTFLLSGFTYLILINDWMGEYRLATPFFTLIYIFLGVAIYRIVKLIPGNPKYVAIGAAVVILLVAGVSIRHHHNRLSKFYEEMPVSFASVAERFGHKFNHYADSLGIQNGSFLVPDIGGTLYYGKLRIYDLAGLCDPVTARTLQKDRARFLNYVFVEIKPTFIHTHGWFTTTARFHEDPRFERDYTPLYEYEDKYASERLRKKIMSGHYVRRDSLNPN